MSETPWQKATSRLRLTGVGPVFAAKCPAHEDRHASLSVTQNSNGDVLMSCHAGCEIDEICRRLDIELKDLFVPKDDDFPPGAPQEIVYPYHDERGNLLYEVVRRRNPGGSKDFRQRRPYRGGYAWGLSAGRYAANERGDWYRVASNHSGAADELPAAKKTVFRLPQLLRAKPDEVVFIVEGEKDVLNGESKLGILATCNLGGAGKGKWLAEWNEYFAERRIVIIPDNDDVGRQHAEEVRSALEPKAQWCVILELPGVPEKGDLSDWIAAGGTREQLDKLVDGARFKRHPHVVFPEEIEARLINLYENGFVPGMRVDWALDEHFRPRLGEWTVLTGTPGSGKTSFMDHLAVKLAEKHQLKFGVFSAENMPMERHYAALLERYIGKPFEEPLTAKGQPRMDGDDLAYGAKFVREYFNFIEPQDDMQSLDDIIDAAKFLIDRRGVQALVIDPWNELDHARPKALTETEFIGNSLATMRRFARRHFIHIFVVAHPAKLQRQKDGKYPVPTLWDISGSAHWNNKADNGIVLHRDRESVDNEVEVNVQKIRFRECGRIGSVSMRYDPPTGRFYDVDTTRSGMRGFYDDDED